MFVPRDYQEKAHRLIVDNFRQNKKCLMVMSTGAGKSKTVVSFVDKYKKHYNFILIVKNRKLVNQLADDCALFKLDYGVTMAAHDMYDSSKSIQVCSIDTVITRGDYPHIDSPKPLVLIIDEADQAASATYQYTINKYLNRKNGKTFFMGMTATPYDNPLNFFDSYFVPITALELLKKEMLIPYKYFVPKCAIDYSDVFISKGEWSTQQVEAKLNTATMIKACFNSWLDFGDNRQTLVFCVNKKHAENFTNFINDYYGKEQAAFIYDKTHDLARDQIQKNFKAGKIRFLVNVRIITRGVDIPEIGTILDCAPTVKINQHIQKLGRGSRPNSFYKDCIVIDPAKNVINCGHFYEQREISLTEVKKRNKTSIENTSVRACDRCFRVSLLEKWLPKNSCPHCGYIAPKPEPKKLSKAKQKKLFLQNASPEMIEQQRTIKEFKKLLWIYKNTGRKYPKDIARDMAHKKLIKKFGIDRVLKVKKAIGFDYEKYKNNQYKPLGGLFD